jgi:hypothetical protein
MIVPFPETPPVDGPLKLPRPAVYLIGSYSHMSSWVDRAARQLERHVGCVFIPGEVPAQEDIRLLKVKWSLAWLTAVDVVGCWIDGMTWDQFELGFVLGRATAAVVIGSPRDDTAPVLGTMLASLGRPSHVHADFYEWLSAVEMAAK